MLPDELPPLKDLIACTPGAQSRDEARAHLAARRNAFGIDGPQATADRQLAAEALLGTPEPLPAADPSEPAPASTGRSTSAVGRNRRQPSREAKPPSENGAARNEGEAKGADTPPPAGIDDIDAFARQFVESRKSRSPEDDKPPPKSPGGKRRPQFTVIDGDKTKD